MSWLPSFLNPVAAAVAAGIVVPALLLLYFLKLRRREVEVASTMLWKKAIQDLQVNAPFQKLRRNLLLLLQLLMLLLLLLALARPVSRYSPGAGKTSVILIDRSASMSARDVPGGSRLNEAKQQAKALVDTMDRNAQAMVIAFDEEARAVQAFTSDRAALKRAIDSIEPTDRRTKLKLAYQLAEAKLAFNPEQLRPGGGVEMPDVWVYSDGRVADADELKLLAPVKYVQIGSDTARNIAVVALSARRNYDRPTEVQIFARLANYGPEPVTAPLLLSIAPIDPSNPGAPDAYSLARVAQVTLLPERWTDQQRTDAERNQNLVPRDSVEFTTELATGAVVRVEHQAAGGDALPADDAAAVVVPPPKPLSVALVTEGNYYLERAIASLNLRNPQQLTPAEYERSLPEADVIIFDRHWPGRIAPGGNFIYFGSLPPGLRLTAAPEGQPPAMIEDVTVLDWRRDHPILRHLQLGKVYAASMLKLELAPDVLTLVDGLKGPMVVLHREGRRTHLIVAFDVMQSNWPLRVSFPVFLHQALQFLAVGAELNVRESFVPGSSPQIARANLSRVPGGEPRRIELIGPRGTRPLEMPETGEFALPPLDHVGVYRLDPVVPQYERIAVNLLDPAESNLLPVKTVPGGGGEVIESAGAASRLEWWWWIVAVVALPLTMIEWWVYTRRMHL